MNKKISSRFFHHDAEWFLQWGIFVFCTFCVGGFVGFYAGSSLNPNYKSLKEITIFGKTIYCAESVP